MNYDIIKRDEKVSHTHFIYNILYELNYFMHPFVKPLASSQYKIVVWELKRFSCRFDKSGGLVYTRVYTVDKKKRGDEYVCVYLVHDICTLVSHGKTPIVADSTQNRRVLHANLKKKKIQVHGEL